MATIFIIPPTHVFNIVPSTPMEKLGQIFEQNEQLYFKKPKTRDNRIKNGQHMADIRGADDKPLLSLYFVLHELVRYGYKTRALYDHLVLDNCGHTMLVTSYHETQTRANGTVVSGPERLGSIFKKGDPWYNMGCCCTCGRPVGPTALNPGGCQILKTVRGSTSKEFIFVPTNPPFNGYNQLGKIVKDGDGKVVLTVSKDLEPNVKGIVFEAACHVYTDQLSGVNGEVRIIMLTILVISFIIAGIVFAIKYT